MGNVSPEPIMKVALGYMASKHLFAANEIGLFEKLAGQPATLDELAKRADIPPRTLRIVADAVVSLGLLDKQDGRYRNGAAAETFLSGGQGADLRPMLRLMNRMLYPQWLDFDAAIRTDGGHTKWGKMTAEERRIASKGIAAWTIPTATALAADYDFGRHRHVLDLAGGTGDFLVALLRRHPALAGTLFELPHTVAVARRALADKPEFPRIKIVEGDLFKDALPKGADAVIIANVVHIFSPARNLDMLRGVRHQVAAGARLLLIDFWTDPTHTEPAAASLMAGEFLLFAGEGDVYSAQEVQGWLAETGWRPVEHRPLNGPASVIVAETTA